MSEDDAKPNWRELALRTAHENDPNKVLQLAQDLIRALDQENPPPASEGTVIKDAQRAA
jgi:hypothetical protein